MAIIADLQLHSRYSRAVSQNMTLSQISLWSKKKGINLVATGDWTHPLWFRSIKSELDEVNSGIFTLKERPNETYFLLSTEISSIYSQGGKLRRVHNLIFSPSIKTCEKIVRKLLQEGCNLSSDGRPIVGLSSVDLLKMVLEIDERVLFIPAHAWTPWFSIFGSKSGFNSLYEAFGSFEKYIFAVETGLSSDPIMNWQIEELENRSLVSFSDAHSGAKLGREATVFVEKNPQQKIPIEKLTYDDIYFAIKKEERGRLKIGFTIEFFPEEGKYHWSGHRLCQVRYSPDEVLKNGPICPVCQKPLTIGVQNRVIELAKKRIKEEDLLFLENKNKIIFVYEKEKKHPPFVSLIPLLEILLELYQSQTKAFREYERLVNNFASEFEILLKKTDEEIKSFAGEKLAQAIKAVRQRKVFVDPGYDGVFGKIKIFPQDAAQSKDEKDYNQQTLFK